MSRFIRHFLLISAIFSMVLLSIAHEKIPQHDNNECSVCLYQSHLDLNSSSVQSFNVPKLYSQKVFVLVNTHIASKLIRAFDGRAPPQSI